MNILTKVGNALLGEKYKIKRSLLLLVMFLDYIYCEYFTD